MKMRYVHNLGKCACQLTKNFVPIMLAIALMLTSGIAMAQDPPQYGTPYSGVPYRMDANIYQMNLREYSSSRNIAGARANLQRVKDLGINVLYLMPIFPVSTDSRASGSPYANTDYKSVAPDLGTLNDLRGLVDDAHNMGMAVILDFIVNQTGWDHPWVTQNPGWYITDGGGAITSPCPAPDFCFGDVAGIDLNVAGARSAMIDAMRYWIFAANVDGFRFDWADQPPQSFWTEAINNLRGISSHDLLLLAEGSNEGSNSGCTTCGNNQPGAHYAQGFDYIFGTNFYWNVMKKVWDSGEPVLNLDGVTSGEYQGAGSTQLVARFLSNHDDYNAEGSPFSFLQGGRNGVMAAFVLATYHRSVPFIYNGIEVGNTNPLPYPWNSGNINWTQDLSVYSEMQQILGARNSSVALRRGLPTSYINPDNSNPNVFAFTKESGGEKVAVLINPRNGNSSFTIPSGMAGSYNDIFNGSGVTWSTGQNVTLGAYQYIVLTDANFTPTPVSGVSVNPTSFNLTQGLTQQLSASISPANASNQNVSWSSSNSSIASVNSNGLVTGVAAGNATITVTTEDGGFTATSSVTVDPATSFTVHFYKPASWGTGINIYYWEVQPAGVIDPVNWPGVTTTDEGDGWYGYTFTNVTSTNLIFNDGTNQTADLSRNGTDGWYQNGVWYDTNPGGCSPTSITPYITVNGGAWVQTNTATLDAGGTVTFGPQPLSGGTWAWVGPNGYGANTREVSFSNVQVNQSGNYTATFTNTGGCTSNEVFTLTVNSTGQSPYNGVIGIPGTIEAEDFDNGGEGEAYHDNDSGNNGGQYRSNEGVDIENCSEGGYNIGWTDAGEWLEYTVNVASSGNYDFDFRVAGAVGGTFRVEFNGVNKTGDVSVPNTGGWQNWQSVNVNNVSLDAGEQVMRIYMVSGGFNLNNVTISAVTGGTGSGYYIRNRWQGTYLYDAGANVGYGGFSTSDNYKWELVAIDGHTLIQNVATGEYMNIEPLNGTVQSSSVPSGYWSAQWAIEDYDGHKRIKNRWQSSEYIHIENLQGNAQHGTIEASWHSNHWALEPVSGARADNEVFMGEKEIEISLTVYPNPVQEELQIELSGWTPNESIQLQVWDISGRPVFQTKSSITREGNLSEKLLMEYLKPGIYHLSLATSRMNKTVTFVKQ